MKSTTEPTYPAVRDLIERMRERPVRQDLEPITRAVQHRRPYDGWARDGVVQVVGSNGKGSLVHYLSQWLTDGGARVLSFTSPHLHHPRERIQVDNRPLSRDTFGELLNSVPNSVRRELTPFELLLYTALERARSDPPDFLLLEAGMGGRWDATSAVPAGVTVLTGVEREHTAFLGETRPEILREKTAQIRRGTKLFVPRLDGKSERRLGEIAARKQLRIVRLTTPPGTIDRRLRWMAAEVGQGLQGGRSPDEVRRRIGSLDPPPGRKQWAGWKGRRVLYDVAHTPEAMEELFRYIETRQDRAWTMVYGCLEGKRCDRMLDVVAGRLSARRVIVTRPPSPRGRDPETVARSWPGTDTSPDTAGLRSVPRLLRTRSEPGEGILVAGSFPLVGWFRNRWHHHE